MLAFIFSFIFFHLKLLQICFVTVNLILCELLFIFFELKFDSFLFFYFITKIVFSSHSKKMNFVKTINIL